MKKFISVFLALTLAFSATVVFAENNNSKKHFVPADMLFDTAPGNGISLMSSDNIKEVIMSGWDNMEDLIDVEKYKVKISDFSKLYESILYANPKYFYVLGSYYYFSDATDTYITEIEPIYGIDDDEEIEETFGEIEAVADEILFLISENMSDFDKIMTVHDYMVEHFSYDWDFYYNSDRNDYETYHHQYTLEIMTRKTGVCQGYTLAFAYMMDKLGIETRFVSSEAMDHAWNLVRVDGDWYHIDVTWDDTDTCGEVNHLYELVSTGCIQTLPNPHYGFELGEIEAASDRFDDAPWHESTAEVAYCHGKAYWIEGRNLVDEDENVIFENLAGADGRWELEGGWYINDRVFSGLAEYNGKLYFNTDKAIYTYDPHTGLTSNIMDKTCVGGLYIDKNILIYANAVVKEDGDGAYITLEDGGTIVLEHARFAEPYIKDGEIVARIYKECDDDIVVFAKTKNGLESEVVKEQGYSSVSFAADDEAQIFYWTSNLKPLRDKEEIIIK